MAKYSLIVDPFWATCEHAYDRDPSITGLLGSIPLESRRHPELADLLTGQQNATMKLLTSAFAEAQNRGEISDRAKPEEQVIAVLGAAIGIGLLQFGLQRSKLENSMEVFIDLLGARLFI